MEGSAFPRIRVNTKPWRLGRLSESPSLSADQAAQPQNRRPAVFHTSDCLAPDDAIAFRFRVSHGTRCPQADTQRPCLRAANYLQEQKGEAWRPTCIEGVAKNKRAVGLQLLAPSRGTAGASPGCGVPVADRGGLTAGDRALAHERDIREDSETRSVSVVRLGVGGHVSGGPGRHDLPPDIPSPA